MQEEEDRAAPRGSHLRAVRPREDDAFHQVAGRDRAGAVEKEILEAENKVGKSVDLLCGMCKRILEETKGAACPSASAWRASPSSKTKSTPRTSSSAARSPCSDFLGEPGRRYSIVDKKAKRTSFDYGGKAKKVESAKMLPMPATPERSGSAEAGDKKGLILGGAGLALGFLLGR